MDRLDAYLLHTGIPLPAFVPSVSSAAKTHLSATAHLQALVDWGIPVLLVSAYDVLRGGQTDQLHMMDLLDEALSNDSLVFLDSGGYEARRFRDRTWSVADYHSAILEIPHSIAFTYDLDKAPVKQQLERTAGFLGDARSLIPIVHGTGTSVLSGISEVAAQGVAAVAVTERDLGAGLDEVADVVRSAVDTAAKCPLHILGAGNPLSILLYAACGAQSFDGLDWCQTVVDPSTGTMHHSKHLPLYESRNAGDSERESDYYLRVLAHNLPFYDHWMTRIRQALQDGGIDALVATWLPRLTGTDE